MGQISEPVIQLLKGKNFASLATLMNDGSPQVTPTWIDFDEDSGSILIPTVEGRIKQMNVSIDPRVAICIFDENNPYNMVLIRGRVIEMTKGQVLDGGMGQFKRIQKTTRRGEQILYKTL